MYKNVEGLATSSAVTINGHTVGKVQDIQFTDDGTGMLQVRMLIESDFKLEPLNKKIDKIGNLETYNIEKYN